MSENDHFVLSLLHSKTLKLGENSVGQKVTPCELQWDHWQSKEILPGFIILDFHTKCWITSKAVWDNSCYI